MDALKLNTLPYWAVLLLTLVSVHQGAEAVTCYSCQHDAGDPDLACVRGTSKTTEPCKTTCKTQWMRNKGNNEMDLVSRGCGDNSDEEKCTDLGDSELCVYLCAGNLCNNHVFTITTTTPGTTTTGYPEHCFLCTYRPTEERTSHCKIVNNLTPITNKRCDKGCMTYVRFDKKDRSIVTDMSRSCNTGNDVESFCREGGDDYNCWTFCKGHMCNHDDYDVIPTTPDDGGNGDGNGQETTPSSSLCVLFLVTLVSLLLTL